MFETIGKTIAEEFTDGSDVASVTRVILRLLIAAVLGAVLGYEREQKGKSAGLRTHILVCLGAALFVLVPQQAGASAGDMTRVLQGVIAGIGFLGAGAIIKVSGQQKEQRPADPNSADCSKPDTDANNGVDVRGLTTAAGIWMTAAIGVAAGLGREVTAILATILALGVLTLLLRIEPKPKK